MQGMIKPIETVYNGYRFRSRLEARWAIFYDTLGIQYSYEPEGFDLGGMYYLPDFYLPQYEYWIEVKHSETSLSKNDWSKISRLAFSMGKTVYVAVGEVWYPYPNGLGSDIKNYHRPIRPDGSMASHSWWYECPKCGGLSLVVFGFCDDAPCKCIAIEDQGTYQRSDTERLMQAYLMARQARFEHGENGRKK